MAIIESGTFGRLPSVDECLAHPSLLKVWGIDSPSVMIVGAEEVETVCVKPVVIGGVTFEIYRHPELLIPDTIEVWKDDYRVKTKYDPHLQYNDFHPCYVEAEKIYESYKGGLSG